METLQVLFIASLIVNVIILILLFVFYQSNRKVLDITPFIKKIDKLRNEAEGKERKVLKEALDKSKDVVQDTLEELEGVEELSHEAKRDLKRQAKKLVHESISKDSLVFQNTIKDITNAYKKELEEFNSFQKSEYSEVISSAKTSINQEVANLRQEIVKASEEERRKVEDELRAYKEKRKEDIDQRVYSIVSDVARETIGESIDISKHEELVMQALNKAKNERFF